MIHTTWLIGETGALSALNTVLEWAASKYAIAGYLALLVAIIAVLVAFMLTNDGKNKTANAANVVIQSQGAGKSVSPTAVTAGPAKDVSEDVEEGAPRFCMLSRIDENKRVYDARRYEEEVSLKRFCDNFRNYAAAELRLYYD
ncbi:MAG: hypothetical protein IKM33_04995, partial [Clostridia bacterium]|nr:hypothetical protein [Clostridia bacterium]